jgi:hypothetical protein
MQESAQRKKNRREKTFEFWGVFPAELKGGNSEHISHSGKRPRIRWSFPKAANGAVSQPEP